MYPQYSFATTLSSIKELKKQLPDGIACRVVENHFDHPGYIESLVQGIADSTPPAGPQSRTHLLFAAHSLPVRYTKAGDPYISQVRATVELVKSRIDPAWTVSLGFQSKVGPVKWQSPSLEEELERISESDCRRLIVLPVSFVSENLETLYDLDIVFREACHRKGILVFVRIPAPGASMTYLQALADLANAEIRKWTE